MAHQQNETKTREYKPLFHIRDEQPIRATNFHPYADIFLIGTNSRSLHVYNYPSEKLLDGDLSFEDDEPCEPECLFTYKKLHRGSIYCATFDRQGELIATGSNDQTVHVVKFDVKKLSPHGDEFELTKHTGTIRDVCFMQSNLLSAGAGDNGIYSTDCKIMKLNQLFSGHEDTVMSVYHWDELNTFASASLDSTIRLWDGRVKASATKIPTSSPACVVRVDHSGKLLVSGHQDGNCMFYDIRAGKVIQLFKCHDADVRTLNFSPKTYYLLTGGYDGRIKLMDLQGDLGRPLPSVEIGASEFGMNGQENGRDKIVQCAWHPMDYNFVTTCADGSATLWVMPELSSQETNRTTTTNTTTQGYA